MKINKCYFCGGHAEYNQESSRIECYRCHAQSAPGIEEDIVLKWNTIGLSTTKARNYNLDTMPKSEEPLLVLWDSLPLVIWFKDGHYRIYCSNDILNGPDQIGAWAIINMPY